MSNSADPRTPHLDLIKPIVNDEDGEDLWGEKLNSNFDKLDANAQDIAGDLDVIFEQALPDAPNDGLLYGRKDLTWAEVPVIAAPLWENIQGKPEVFPPEDHLHLIEDVVELQMELDLRLTDAPADGKQYARKNLAWAEFASPIPTDAPADGKTYGRKNNAWEPAAGAAQISDCAPTLADDNTFWWDSDAGGLYIRYRDPNSVAWIQVGGTALIDAIREAPLDGKVYGRKDAAWTALDITVNWGEIVGIPDLVEEAPADGAQYVREDGAWQEVDIPPPGIGEAPIDGQQYVRSDAGWEQVEVPPGTVIADNAPTAPPNTLWWSSASGLLSIRYDDGNSQQWVGLNGALSAAVTISDTPPAATFRACYGGRATPAN